MNPGFLIPKGDHTISKLNFRAAGRVLESAILDRWHTIHAFHAACPADRQGHKVGLGTLYKVCDGSYNYPNGPSLELLWYIARLVADEDIAHVLMLEYFVRLGVVATQPRPDLVEGVTRLHLRLNLLAADARVLAARERRRAKRDRVGTDGGGGSGDTPAP